MFEQAGEAEAVAQTKSVGDGFRRADRALRQHDGFDHRADGPRQTGSGGVNRDKDAFEHGLIEGR